MVMPSRLWRITIQLYSMYCSENNSKTKQGIQPRGQAALMPPSIKVNTKRPKVLFQQKVGSNKINHDLMGPHHTRTTTTSTTATITTAVTTSLRTPHQKVSRPRSGKGPRSRAAVDELTATPGKQDRIIMDPVGIGKTSDIEWDTMLGVDQNGYFIPDLFTSLPPLQDTLETKTSRVQDETVQECLPLLAGIHDPSRSLFDFNSHGLPRLEREKHIKYLHSCLNELPARFVVHDASRPWILYWVLAGLCLLGEDVQQYRSRFIALEHVQRASSLPYSANRCALQSGADFIPNAESGWWLWRGSRPNVTLCANVCSNSEPSYGWWKGKLGYD